LIELHSPSIMGRNSPVAAKSFSPIS